MTNFYTRRLFKPISTILSVSVLALTAGAQVQHTNAVKSQPAVKTQPAGKAQAPDNTRQSSPSQAVQSFGFHTSGEKMEELYVYYTSLNVINTVKLNTGAADDDPSGIATYSQTGAQFGYGQLWTALWMLPLMTADPSIKVSETVFSLPTPTGQSA